jgi:hypothetical protein
VDLLWEAAVGLSAFLPLSATERTNAAKTKGDKGGLTFAAHITLH